MKGIPTYTQHTVAFPRVTMGERSQIDEINVCFNAKGGGAWGEFTFVWYDHSGAYPPGSTRDRRAMRVAAFSGTGMKAMLDRRIFPIIEHLSRRNDDLPEVYPADVIKWLEEAGVRPSTYHLLGLYEQSHGRVEFWPKDARRQFDALRQHEEAT